ncbi:MAG: FAD:protein FMN transferase [Erysipelotrichaceae bacterium]
MKLKNFLFILLILSLGACKSEPVRFSNVLIDVGFNDAPVTFVAYTENEAEFNQFQEILREELLILGQLFDKYNNYEGLNNLKTINDNAGIKPVEVDQKLIDLITFAKEYYTITQNTFDISMGSVLEVWHNYRDEGKLLNSSDPAQYGRVPTLEELQIAKECVSWDFIEINDENNTVYINNPCASLDVGGIAKGYAADIVVNKLLEAGLETAIINIGDSSIITIGTKPNGDEWGVGIAQPKKNVLIADSSVDTLYFEGSIHISTSGDNQNYYIAEGDITYHHLIDPSTLYPVVTSLHSVTIATSLSAASAEALSKAMFILPYDDALELLNKLKAENPNEVIDAVWVYELDQAPSNSESKGSAGFSVVHSKDIQDQSRLYR